MPAVVAEQFVNGPGSTLNGAITNVATSLIVTDATKFPTVPQFRALIESELVLVTAVAGTTYTIARAQEGTTAAAHASGVAIVPILTAEAQRRWAPDYVIQPRHHKLLAWTGDPAMYGTSFVALGGTPSLHRIWIPENMTIANIVAIIQAGGATLTAGQNMMGIRNAAGTLLGRTADQSTAWTTAGQKVMPLTAEAGQSLALIGGPDVAVWVDLLTVGTTKPSFRGLPDGLIYNVGLVSPDKLRAGTLAAGQTTLPATRDLTILTQHYAATYFAALS